jgi:hypothetical protein
MWWWVTLPLLAGAGLFTGYLALLTVAAMAARLRPRPPAAPEAGSPRHRFAIVIPAHDASARLPRLLEAVAALDYPLPRYEVVVVADNCDDDTAEVALIHGARVLSRRDPAGEAAGPALGWAFGRLLPERRHDAFVILGTDSRPAPDLLRRLDAALEAGARVVQARGAADTPARSWRTALLAAELALTRDVRPAGRQALGGSADLRGSGICLHRQALRWVPWETATGAEGHEYHVRLLSGGFTAVFAPEAVVYTVAGTTGDVRRDGGRLALMGRVAGPLVRMAWTRRGRAGWACLDTALELATPPLTVLVAGAAAMATLHAAWWSAGGPGWPAAAWALLLAVQAFHGLGGCALAGVPARAYAALLVYGPVHALGTLGASLRLAAGNGGPAWAPTPRQAAVPERAA